ncbi:MAG: phosphomannomutase/phosphoglucomutase [Arenimonas sp.]
MKKPSIDLNALKAGGWRPLVAGLCVLLGLWMIWKAYSVNADQRLTQTVELKRAQIVQAVNPVVTRAIDKLNVSRERNTLIAALKRGDIAAARTIVSEGWPELEQVDFYPPDLKAAYADPQVFGFGKLTVLETALDKKATYLAIAKDNGGPRIALAAPVNDEQGQVLQLVYVRITTKDLVAPFADAAPSGAYMSLRQGRYDVVESGDGENLRTAIDVGAMDIAGTPLKVIAVAPDAPTGLFEMKGVGELIVAFLFFIAGVVVMMLPKLLKKRKPAADDEAGDHQTLAQLQEAGNISSPEEKKVVVRPTSERAAVAKIMVNRSIFRAYDIRGVMGETLDVPIAKLIGHAVGSLMHEKNIRSICVGRDGRLSSPELSQALIDGLRMAGREIIDLGLVPTPLVYFGTYHLRTGTGISVTGSHNPPNYNGFKIVVDGETLSGDAIMALHARITENKLHRSETVGTVIPRDISDEYIQRVSSDIQIERKLRVVIDCGSGAAGELAPRLLEAIGAEVEPLFCEIDGTFPHHHPDPSDPENLVALTQVVKRTGADIGLALDGDGDRLGVVTSAGEMIYPDKLLMLFAADVLERNPGACIIYDVKCTNLLPTQILRYGGSPLMWKTGHSLIKSKMKETEAELAGEMSGHFFFRERWYGFDDGLYAAARLLEILAASPETADEMFAALPRSVSTPELKVSVAEGEQYTFIQNFVEQAKFDNARISTIDGLRADWSDGWGLVRASNTTPTLVMRFDAKDTEALNRVKLAFREQMLKVDSSLSLPF